MLCLVYIKFTYGVLNVCRRGSAQQRLYAGYKLHCAERLGYIVVSAAVKPHYFIVFGGFSG